MPVHFEMRLIHCECKMIHRSWSTLVPKLMIVSEIVEYVDHFTRPGSHISSGVLYEMNFRLTSVNLRYFLVKVKSSFVNQAVYLLYNSRHYDIMISKHGIEDRLSHCHSYHIILISFIYIFF